MKRFLSVLVLAFFVMIVSQGCSLTYWHSEYKDGYKHSEFGLLSADGWREVPGGTPGLIPLCRQTVQIPEPGEE